jgi:hypothetical protein
MNGFRFAAAVVAAVLLAGPARSAERVGRVLVSIGQVEVVRDGRSAVPLARGDTLRAGDLLRTGPGGRIQLRMRDGALVALRPGSRFRVERYREGDEGGTALLELLEGGLRTLTGTIGGEDEYRLQTPVATIGVRGTQYALRLCDAACTEATGVGHRGLYGAVRQGGVRVRNGGGKGLFGPGQFFHVPASTRAPRPLVRPPRDLFGDLTHPGKGVGDGLAEAAHRHDGRGVEPGLVEVEPAVLEETFFQEYARGDEVSEAGDPVDLIHRGLAFAGGIVESGGVLPEPVDARLLHPAIFNEVYLNAEGQVVGIEEFDDHGRLIREVYFQHGPLESAGSDPELEVHWGRWSGDLLVEGADLAGEVYTAGAFHFMYGGDPTTAGELAGRSGTATFIAAGGTRPSDRYGGDWRVDILHLGVDFTAQRIRSADLGLSSAAQEAMQLSAAEGADLGLAPAFRVDLAGSYTDGAAAGTAEGVLEGHFVGAGADGAVTQFEVTGTDAAGTEQAHLLGTRLLVPAR